MNLLNFQYILLTACFSALLSPMVVRLVVYIGLVDYPEAEPHKTHHKVMPLAGGIVIFIVILATTMVRGLLVNKDLMAILIAGIVVLIFGVVDDFRPLSPAMKLVGQMTGTVLMIILGVRVKIFPFDFVNLAVTLLWMVGITNAFNFVDSMDGLASGLALIAAGFFMLVSYDSGQVHLSSFSAIMVGVCTGVYYFSALPARYFLGDSGAQLLGFLLGGLAIAYNPFGFMPSQSWFIPVMLLGVPIFDMVLVIISRFRKRKPIYHSSLDHTYHRLVKTGMHPNRSVLTMHISAVLLGCLAFIALTLPPFWANIVFSSTVLVGGAVMIYLEKWT